MNVSLFIARRYFLSKKKKNFINVISTISMLVVGIGTMCLIIALSVFNGLEGLLKAMYGNFDPDLIIIPKEGKSTSVNSAMIRQISTLEGVLGVSEVVEDNVLIKYRDAQRVVRMKGVDSVFENHSGISKVLVSGQLRLKDKNRNYAIIGRGVQYDLSVNTQNDFYPLQLYFPNEIKPGVINPERMFNIKHAFPSASFALEKYYDENYIFVPIDFARDLIRYENRVNSYEIYLDASADKNTTRSKLHPIIGDNLKIITGEELHADLYKILKIEKVFVFLILSAIIAIASINIYFSLTMLVIEKKKDISGLFAIGASSKLIRNIFFIEGSLIAFTGAIIGLILGIALSMVQEKYGLIGIGMQSAVVSSYPVKVIWSDILFTGITIILITLAASLQPSLKAGKLFSTESLQ